jgi:hypothetical protein
MNTDIDPNNEDCHINIRSDMWPTMNTHQLNIQLELVVTKISVLLTMSPNDPTVQTMRFALQKALDYLTDLINNKTEPKDRTRM